MASDVGNLHYWDRLTAFRLLSNQRRMERYKIFYLWKSLNGFVPSLGVKWKTRDNTKLVYPKTFGSKGRARTLQKFSLKWEGVRLFNSLPKNIRTFKGSKEAFKNILDTFLSNIPDQPETTQDKPGGRTLLGDSSNSIPDWIRVLGLQCDDDDDILDDEDDEIDGPADDGGDASFINVCASISGPGLSPGHGLM